MPGTGDTILDFFAVLTTGSLSKQAPSLKNQARPHLEQPCFRRKSACGKSRLPHEWRLTGGSLLGNADQGRGTPEKARREEGVKMGGAQEGRQFRKKDKRERSPT